MQTAISEVVSNAIRFARSAVAISSQSATGEVHVTVLDDGPGFAGPIPRRFSPSPSRGGLGLSLALVSDVVHEHEGSLTIRQRQSDANGSSGTCVVIALRQHVQSAVTAESS